MRMTLWIPVTPARVSERCTRGAEAWTSCRSTASSLAGRLTLRIVRVHGRLLHPLPWPGVRGEPSDLSNLVVDACHDLRTPLAAAYGFARTIELTLQAAELSGHPLERDVSAGLVETDAGRAVTSLAWLAAPIAEAQSEAERAWHIVGKDT